MTWRAILSDVELHGALPEGVSREQVAKATVAALGDAILDADRPVVARMLPGPIADALKEGRYEGELDGDGFVARVAARTGEEPSHAVEHAKLVCESLAAHLPEDAAESLRSHLPPAIAAWIAQGFAATTTGPPERRQEAPQPGSGQRLSTGKPGPQDTVAETRHPVGHEHSVARSSDPHADTRLSSTQGTKQEREHETLAEGHEGSHHPVSEEDT